MQSEVERLDLNLVTAQRLSQAELDSIEANIRRDVDQRMRVVVNYLDEIPRTDAGKHRFVVGLREESEQYGRRPGIRRSRQPPAV